MEENRQDRDHEPQGLDEQAHDASAEPTSAMGRRNFLQVGLLGMAAASCAGMGATPPGGDAPSKPGGGGGAGRQTPVTPVKAGDPETWNEPWVWRPSDWPGQQLDLNVVENQTPGPAVGLGNPGAILFSYGGNTPGPTVRMKGDEILHVKLRNLLGQDFGTTAIGPFPDPRELTPDLDTEVCALVGNPNCQAFQYLPQVYQVTGADVRDDFCLGEHTNGVHAVRVTNLHTHGLHVRPSRNPNGTHSDNVILRVLSQADFNRREQDGAEASCEFLANPDELYFLRDDEQAGEANYEFRLGNVQRRWTEAENERRAREGLPLLSPQKHPAGTFWYHPHAHGATHNQVASGMAGFLIVEGDIDDSVNEILAGSLNPDPTLKTGRYDYRERLVFFQRVLKLSQDPDAPTQELRQGAQVLTNGNSNPLTITMRPGALERWRVLNGSVDGRGFKRFMVVKGQYTVQNGKLFEVDASGNLMQPPIGLPQLEALEAKKQDLYQLSIDGIALVREDDDGRYRYYIKDLSQQNAGSANPLWTPEQDCLDVLRRERSYRRDPKVREAADTLCRLQNVWKNGDHVKNCYVRPNEFYMGPANRTDLFFKAPPLSSGATFDVYTILAKAVLVHSDNPQESAQHVINGQPAGTPSAQDVVVAYVLVQEEQGETPIDDYDVKRLMRHLSDRLPPVQPYLWPIKDDELRVTREEIDARTDVSDGDHRTRIVSYSGWGAQDYPLVSTYPSDPSADNFKAFLEQDNGQYENRLYAKNGEDADGNPYYVMMAPAIRTMALKFNNPTPNEPSYAAMPTKFDPNDPNRAQMLEETAEEWAVYNISALLWGNTTTNIKSPTDDPFENTDPRLKSFTQPTTQYKAHYLSYPISRAEGQRLFLENHDFQVVTRGVDHPFHIHQNPFWVTRIEIPDENGVLKNILDEPRWMDSIWLPRHRGRVVFRTRFPDYVGAYVHHCHILLHEDNGMMHVVEATPFADACNYNPQRAVASGRQTPGEVDRVYPRPDADQAFFDNSRFFDPDPSTGQTYPGFDVVPPRLDA